MNVTPCRPTHRLFGHSFSCYLRKECVDSVISSSYAAPMDATIEEQAVTQLEEPLKLEIGQENDATPESGRLVLFSIQATLRQCW